MNYTGTIYRPPFEAASLLLQVTVGCSHNKCSFCYMYPDVPFSVSPLSEVEADIDEASRLYPNVERVFLENGDAFVLSADKLEHIADMIHEKLPKVEFDYANYRFAISFIVRGAAVSFADIFHLLPLCI